MTGVCCIGARKGFYNSCVCTLLLLRRPSGFEKPSVFIGCWCLGGRWGLENHMFSRVVAASAPSGGSETMWVRRCVLLRRLLETPKPCAFPGVCCLGAQGSGGRQGPHREGGTKGTGRTPILALPLPFPVCLFLQRRTDASRTKGTGQKAECRGHRAKAGRRVRVVPCPFLSPPRSFFQAPRKPTQRPR